MAEFWVGTSGWHYDHWRGTFYPEGLAKREWLSYYLEHFQTVELNNSFYQQPKDKAWDGWHDAAPPGFRFAVKANRYITHMKRLKDCQGPVARFLKGAERLKSHLGPILYQTPPNFQRTDLNAERLDKFLRLLPRRHRHVFEFRHDSWFGDETMDLLRRHRVGFCFYDMPGVRCPLVATAPFAYIRFHGSEEMYATNYSDQMLGGWVGQLRKLARGLDEVWIYFNNDAQGFAVANAMRLSEMLATSGGSS